MIKWFWRLYAVVLLSSGLLFSNLNLAGHLEQRIMPIRSAQSITDIVRTETQLCWDWRSTKERAVISPNVDVFIDTPDDHYSSSIWENTPEKSPWSRSRAVGIGSHVQPYCVTLPASIKPTDKVTVRQRIFYPGLGPWMVPVDIPDVVSDPAHQP